MGALQVFDNLRSFRPNISWQEQPLGQEALALTADVLISSSLDDQLRTRLADATRRLSGLGVRFAG